MATPLVKPSQSFVANYIARRSELPSPRAQVLTPRSGTGRKHIRIFYPLDEDCPGGHQPKLHEVDSTQLAAVKYLLLFFCLVQIVITAGITWVLRRQVVEIHDYAHEVFTYGAVVLCCFAAMLGALGVCLRSLPLLLFFYINQLWSLSNVCNFFVMYLQSDQRTTTTCALVKRGELTLAQAQGMGLGVDCDDVESRTKLLLGVMVMLLTQLWVSCFLCKTYSEMVQTRRSDDNDRRLTAFVWTRRRETWTQLRRFEDVVQRQFEELRSSLVSRQGVKQGFTAAMPPGATSAR